jgi:hypothetical protein
LTGAEWQEVLDIKNVAWDIYFLYGPDVTWSDLASYPEFFMNQIGLPEEVSPRLDGDVLGRTIGEYMKDGR